MRGVMNAAAYEDEIKFIKESLAALKLPHWEQFLAAWA
jgi:hypothetical protein